MLPTCDGRSQRGLDLGRVPRVGLRPSIAVDLASTPMCLRRHLAVGHVVQEPGGHLFGGAALRLPVLVGAGERVEVARHRELAVDERVLAIERPPEIVHVARIGAGDARPRARGAAGSRRPASQRRRLPAWARRASRSRSERCRSQMTSALRPRDGSRGDPVDGPQERRGPAEAGVLGLEDATASRQVEKTVHVRGDRLRMIHRRLGADRAVADLVATPAGPGEEAPGRIDRQRHRVLMGSGDRHARHAEAFHILGGVDPARLRQIRELDIGARHGDRQSVDSY